MAEPARTGILGILISQRRFDGAGGCEEAPVMPEDDFCRRLCAYGQTIGMLVFLFCASHAASAGETIGGYALRSGEWRPESFPLPDVVYDRALPASAAEARRFRHALARLKQRKRYALLNGSLPGKLDVFRAMAHDEALRPLLPETEPYEGAGQLARLLARHPGGLFLKPAAGMHGKGALRLLADAEGWRADGRDRHNRPLARRFRTREAAGAWLDRFASAAPYLVQPCLRLTDEEGRAFDVRALLQKDAGGRWTFTGAAVRRGGAGSVTANLHGGGTAATAAAAFRPRFGEDGAAELLARVRRASERAGACLEAHFGRFAELGLDFGLEPDGRLWLLEANAKPGRASFAADADAAEAAVRRPLDYAMLLASRQRPLFPTTRIQRRYIQEVHP
ncbi:YheC/D like ATP-grasp [Paenibacillus sp. UNC496MF]|uniref:YheC/YheD family endospore coat-associated protein n=1 Tax=Paenibacillus sp. UNC496MF TaxID=1502753 RepID=UPI0008F1A066|nr:YheC/YheD family protein [Paenibacillus sp. UNC496MF]SFI93096.1 YheC/D like ATP-grasp [Paenibacillus sp. UNC496MF]